MTCTATPCFVKSPCSWAIERRMPPERPVPTSIRLILAWAEAHEPLARNQKSATKKGRCHIAFIFVRFMTTPVWGAAKLFGLTLN